MRTLVILEGAIHRSSGFKIPAKAPPVRALYASLFLPAFVVGIPVARASLLFALVIPSAVFMLGFLLRMIFIVFHFPL